MCLILLAYGQCNDFPLIVISNRDEFYARPTRAAHWWEDSSNTFGGRDLEAQGTWMGVSKQGRFAAVTNVREPGRKQLSQRSRGDLTREFLTGSESIQQFLARIASQQDDYAGFNLLIGDSSQLWSYSNRQPGIRKLTPGFYGVSNGFFDEAWPKLTSGKIALEQALRNDTDDDALIDILSSEQQASDEQLPTTGIPLEKERLLSSRFIKLPDYGTRASSLVKFSNHNTISFTEQSFDPDTTQKSHIDETFAIELKA
ncbi:MAG: hypothetical protein ACJA0I_000770 [Gammaproteobacteria bacterium]|jgi:uncharacterized protein with NRDE domain